MIATAVTQYRNKTQRAWIDVSGKELDVLRAAPDLYEFRTIYVPSSEARDELAAFKNYKSMRGEATDYKGDGCFGFIVQDQWEAWQHRADTAILLVVEAARADTTDFERAEEGVGDETQLRIEVSVDPGTTKVKIFNGQDKAFEQEIETPDRNAARDNHGRGVVAAGAVAIISPDEKQPAPQPPRYISQLK